MATDAALLAVGVKTEGATQATNELKNLADQAGKTENATNKLSGSLSNAKQPTAAFSDNISGAQRSMDNMAGPIKLVTVGVIALAAAAAAVSFAKSVHDAIAFAASLQDMHEKTGASTTALQKIAPAAAIAGVSFESVEQAVTIMSKNMAGADDKSKGLGKALDTLGISARDSNGKMKDGATIYVEMSGKMEQYGHSSAKVGLAMEAMGRSGAEQLKVMAAMAEAQKYAVIATDEQVAAADRYNDNLAKLSLAGGAFAKIIGHEVAPVLADFTDVLLDVAMGSGGAKDNLQELARDGTLRAWAQQAALWVAEVIDVFDALTRVAQILWKALATGVEQTMEMFSGLGTAMRLALQGNFSGAVDAAKSSFDKMKASGTQFVNDFDTIASRAQFSTMLKAKFAETNAATATTKKASEGLALTWKDADTAAAKYADDMGKLTKAISDGNDKLKLEGQAISQTKLERELANAKIEREKALRDDTLKLTATQINKLFDEREAILRANDARRQQKEALEAAVKGYIELGEEILKASKAEAALMTGVRDQTKEMEKQIKTYGMSTEALRIYNIEEKRREALEKAVTEEIKKEVNAEYDKQLALAKTITAQEQAAEATKQWEDTLKQADAVGYDFFQAMGDGMDGIKDWAKSAGDALKKYLLAVLYEMTAKPFVVSIMTSLSGGAMSGAANASGGGLPSILGGGNSPLSSLFGGNSPLGSLGSMFGGTLGVGGGAAGTFAVSSMGEALGLSTAMGAGEGAMLTGLGSGLIAAIPWAGLAAMAIPLIMSFFDDGPAMRSGTFASGAGSQGGNPLFSGESEFGSFGVVNDKWFSDADMGAAMGAFMDGIKGIDNALASIIGKDLTGQVATALASVTTEFEAGIEGEAVTFGSIMKERYIAVFDVLDVRLGTVVEGFEGTAEELAKFLVTLADVYMMTEKLPEDVGNTLLDVLAAGILTVEEIGRFATAYVSLQNIMAIDPVAFVLTELAAANETAFEKVTRNRGALQALLRDYDGSVEATERLNAATGSYVQAQIEAIAQIEGLKRSLGDMFADSRTLIADFFLTNEQKADKLMADAAHYQELLKTTLDPTLIEKYSRIINSDLTEAFRLLSPEQQRIQQNSFLAQINATETLTNQRLEASTASITQSGKSQISIMETINVSLQTAAQAMISAAAAMNHAADKQDIAADTALQAARTPVDVNVDQTVYVEYIDPSNGA